MDQNADACPLTPGSDPAHSHEGARQAALKATAWRTWTRRLRRSSLVACTKLGDSHENRTDDGVCARVRWPRLRRVLLPLPVVSRKPEPAKPKRWDIYKAAGKAKLIGTVEAADADEAIQKAAEQFNQAATKLIAVRYR